MKIIGGTLFTTT